MPRIYPPIKKRHHKNKIERTAKAWIVNTALETKKEGYNPGFRSFNLLADSFDEALKEARKRLRKNEVIEQIKFFIEF